MTTKTEHNTRNRPLPEMLGRSDGFGGGAWTVEACPPTRGLPATSVEGRFMNVPMSDDPLSQAIRIHEMVHAKVSPSDLTPYIKRGFASEASLRSVEEVRVNFLANKLGYDMSILLDGGESETGERLVALGDWNTAVQFAVATIGTDGHKKFLNGVRRHSKVWGSVLTDISRRVKKEITKTPSGQLSGTGLNSEGFLVGFLVTESIAHWVDRLCDNTPDKKDEPKGGSGGSDDDGDGSDAESSDAPKKRGRPKSETDKAEIDDAVAESRKIAPTGSVPIPAWFPLNVEKLPMPDVLTGAMGRKRIASNSGKHPRRLHRYLTDPHRRVFDRTIKGKGGLVVIDGSGSMHLNRDEVMNIVLSSPGCTVLVYCVQSWAKNDDGEATDSNAWVLADKGRIVDTMPDLGGGNGVDLPVLKWAVGERRSSRTPIVWVCDGYVTGHGDALHDSLTLQAVEYCLANSIAIVPDAESAVKYLNDLATGVKPRWSFPHPMRDAYTRLSGERLVA